MQAHALKVQIVSFIRSLWDSTPSPSLEVTKKKMAKDAQELKNEAQKITSEDPVQLGYRLANELKVGESNVEDNSESIATPEVSFPMRSGIPTRNYTFIGREDLLEDMHKTLQQASSGPTCCVLHGIGGIGKTETASQFTYNYRNVYDAVFWLPAERVQDLETEYSQIAVTLGFRNDESPDRQKRINVLNAREWLEQTSQ